jgi:hypothetical protein
MKKKKVTKQESGLYRHGYFTFMEYFATGEGFTYEINFCYADTKKEAIEKHLDRFVGDRKESRDYFGCGVAVYRSDSKKAADLIKQFFVHHEAFIKHMNAAGIEFYFKTYYNYS